MKMARNGQGIYDQHVFALIVLAGLALALNAHELLKLAETHMGPWWLRFVIAVVVLVSTGLIGLFSRRIALRITAWRDHKPTPAGESMDSRSRF